ncbi:MAG: glucose-6-phosphate isomerase [Phycisphaerales bacterium]
MLHIDYANCFEDRVGEHGLDPSLLEPASDASAACAALTRSLAQSRGKGWERWRNLAQDPMRADHTAAVHAAVERCRGRFDTMVVLGIGGSALGNIALQSALNPPTYNLMSPPARRGPRVFVIDNVDPAYFAPFLELAASQPGGLQRTLFNVISKSGETAETAAQFMIIRDMLKKAVGPAFGSHIVAVTDPARGTMRKICEADGYATLPVPDGVGGRFSVLSPVGLFSAAMAGIDINSLLEGAAEMDDACSREDLMKNPAALLALLLVELGQHKGKTNHVLMPYSNSLYLLADWFRQLWAESLGKQFNRGGEEVFAGFTPIKALGTTDQHSQVQLYREGPNDKVVGLIAVDRSPHDVTIPTGMGVEALQYLEGKKMSELLNAERRATEYALVESLRPNFTISFPTIDERHVGQFVMLWQIATAYAGLLLGVDAYDQPAVELGKQATFGLMGRKGYEEHLTNVQRTLTPTRWVWPQ